MRVAVVVTSIAISALISACDQCAATPSCRGLPEFSYSGQFIEHKSGAPVGGVSITYVRRAGVEAASGTLNAVSDAGGFFTLRAGALGDGATLGELRVVPPAPHAPFTIPDVTLETNRVRGDGRNFGRLVVNPYLFLIGHVHDRKTRVQVESVSVTMRRIGGGRLDQDSNTFVTDDGGNFSWEPRIVDLGNIQAVFELSAPGHPRPYLIRRDVPVQYRDMDVAFVDLPLGWGLSYNAGTVRRASYEALPGVTVEFERIAGINIQPEKASLPVNQYGAFPIAVEPLSEGTLTAELRITPPPPMRPETTRVELQTTDDDIVQSLGFFRYGAQVAFDAQLRDASTSQPLPEGTVVAIKRIGGVSFAWSMPAPDSAFWTLTAQGDLGFQAPTADSGSVLFDLVVRLATPFAWDTITGVSVPARYSDSTFHLGTLGVRQRLRP